MFTCCSCEELKPVVGRRDAGETEDEDDGRLEDEDVFCC